MPKQENVILTAELQQMKDHIQGKFGTFRDAAPPSVQAIYKLAQALNNYQGDITAENDGHRFNMLIDMKDHLLTFLNNTAGYAKKPDSPEYRAQVGLFEQNCAKSLKENYKYMAAEPTFWNAVKDLFNDACKACGFKPQATLDASSVIKSKDIKEQFSAIKTGLSATVRD